MDNASTNQVDGGASLVVHCGRLIDGTGSSPREGVSLVVTNGTIERVVETARWEAEHTGQNVRLIDAGDRTVLPGLMDIHIHLVSIVDPDEPNTELALLGTNSPLATLHAAKNARLMLEAGFTTVRDMAGYTDWTGMEMVALRRGIEIGLVPGSRVFCAGWVGMTAGHHDMGRGTIFPRPEGYVADGPWEVRRQVREFARLGVDLIKTSSSGGIGHGEERWWRNYTYEELEAICDEAHAFGKRVAVHVHTPEAIQRAIRAGVDTIEHGTDVDEETMDLMAERGVFLIPTLSYRSPRGIAARARGGAAPDIIVKLQQNMAAGTARVAAAHRRGVKIACGTDTFKGLRQHWGENAYELERLVESGLSPMEAICAATRVSAEALGQEKRLGTLEAGKAADLLVFQGDPLQDIKLLQEKARIQLVIKEGKIAVDRRDPRQHAL